MTDDKRADGRTASGAITTGPDTGLSALSDGVREATAAQIAGTPPGGPVTVTYPSEAERQLRAAGRCWYQTGYGLPGFEYAYCGHLAPPGYQPGTGPGPDDEPATWGMCVRHAREALGASDPAVFAGDRVSDTDPEADPGWHGTVTHADNNGYRVRWDGQHQDCQAAYGEIAPVSDPPGAGVLALRRLEAAVRADHPCDDRACGIAAALTAGCWHTAAWLLGSATGEHPQLTRLLAAGAAALPQRLEDCRDQEQWMSFRRDHGHQCPACGCVTYGDTGTVPAPCAGCGAPLPAGHEPLA